VFQELIRKFITLSPLKVKSSLGMMVHRLAVKVLHEIVPTVNFFFLN